MTRTATMTQDAPVRVPKQLELFDQEPAASPGNGGAGFSDPAFAGNKTAPIHRWVPWIAGFSSDFVRDAASRYLERPGTILDPFAGVGTTLIDAAILGHRAIGFEINPYAAFACRTKAQAHQVSVEQVLATIARFQEFYQNSLATDYTPHSVPPPGFKTRAQFYSPQVLRKVLIIQDFIDEITTPALRDLFRLAFASTMVRYSNYSYEPSLGRRVSAGKEEILDFAVAKTVVAKLLEMAEDIAWMQTRLPGSEADVQVINDTFFRYADYLRADSVDLIITSPPYLNNYHYNRNTRPQLYWLGYVHNPQDMTALETANFGKYWQTVREQEPIPLDFDLPGSDLEERLHDLRALHPEKGLYGGHGWANYAASYFNDCHRFAQGMLYALRAGGTALVVIGNSILQGLMIPTDQYLGQIAQKVGLELVRIDIPRATRVGNSIIQSDVRVVKASKFHQLYEAVVELRKR